MVGSLSVREEKVCSVENLTPQGKRAYRRELSRTMKSSPVKSNHAPCSCTECDLVQ